MTNPTPEATTVAAWLEIIDGKAEATDDARAAIAAGVLVIKIRDAFIVSLTGDQAAAYDVASGKETPAVAVALEAMLNLVTGTQALTDAQRTRVEKARDLIASLYPLVKEHDRAAVLALQSVTLAMTGDHDEARLTAFRAASIDPGYTLAALLVQLVGRPA